MRCQIIILYKKDPDTDVVANNFYSNILHILAEEIAYEPQKR